ncbi:hypothetical protein Pfo_001773, partial [Paulownia fortunei]
VAIMEKILRYLDTKFDSITTIIEETKYLETTLGFAASSRRKEKKCVVDQLFKIKVQPTNNEERFDNNRSQHGRGHGQGRGRGRGRGRGSNFNNNSNNYKKGESSARGRG